MSYGQGTIERRPNGTSRVRVYVDGRPRTLGTYPTQELAASALRGFLALRAAGEGPRGITLRTYGNAWLDRRELAGGRNIVTDRSRWECHVEGAAFIDWPLVDIARRDVRAWLDGLAAKPGRDGARLGWQSRKHALALLRRCLADAVDEEILERSPALALTIKRPAAAPDGWTYLTPDEQHALITCEKIPRPDRLVIAFALATGLRQGELWNLELVDLVVDGPAPHVLVRWGKPGLPPKNGKIRRVPLTATALDVARAWLEQLPGYLGHGRYENSHGLAFPTARACRRQDNKPIRHWAKYLTAAGLVAAKRHDRRDVRWHDLRHSCASSLVAGWWGRAWRLDEVRDVLGHSSVTVTERYAHLAPGVLAEAAAATRQPSQDRPTPSGSKLENPLFYRRATKDSNLRPSAPEIHGKANGLAYLDPLGDGSGTVRLRELAGQYLRAVETRSRFSARIGVELAAEALEVVRRLDVAADDAAAEGTG